MTVGGQLEPGGGASFVDVRCPPTADIHSQYEYIPRLPLHVAPHPLQSPLQPVM